MFIYRLVSRTTIISTIVGAIVLLLLIVYLSPHSTSSETLEKFPFTPSDLAQQCHDWYSLDKMPDHSGRYLHSGEGEDEEELGEEDEGVCERTLVYLLDGEVGVRLLLTSTLLQSAELTFHNLALSTSPLSCPVICDRQVVKSYLLHRRYALGQGTLERSLHTATGATL